MDKVYTTPLISGERIKQFLKEGKRFDGRAPGDVRELHADIGISKFAEGSVRVKMGATEVVVGVKMDVGTPYPDSMDQGNLIVSAELTPMSSSRYEAGPPKFPAIELGRVIDRGIRESKVIDLKKLCIAEGEKVWNVYIDIYSINDDGNLLDAAGIGAIIALSTARIPKYDEETKRAVHGEWSSEKFPISKNVPISVTVHKLGDHFLVDPTREEEDISETRVTIGISNGVISSMQKGELKSISIEELEKILDLAEKTERQIFKKIEKYLK